MLEFGYAAEDFCGMGSGVYRLQPFFTTSNSENGGGDVYKRQVRIFPQISYASEKDG